MRKECKTRPTDDISVFYVMLSSNLQHNESCTTVCMCALAETENTLWSTVDYIRGMHCIVFLLYYSKSQIMKDVIHVRMTQHTFFEKKKQKKNIYSYILCCGTSLKQVYRIRYSSCKQSLPHQSLIRLSRAVNTTKPSKH